MAPCSTIVSMTAATLTIRGNTVHIRQFEVAVVEGPCSGDRVASRSEELSVGSDAGNDLRLGDPAVSRHHCVLRIDERGLALVDLGSRNGTFIGEVEVASCYIKFGT